MLGKDVMPGRPEASVWMQAGTRPQVLPCRLLEGNVLQIRTNQEELFQAPQKLGGGGVTESRIFQSEDIPLYFGSK